MGWSSAPLVAALNVPVEERLRQLELNMERWRWLPRELGTRYLLINIANFTLEVVDQDQPVLTMRTIVGRPDRPTPILQSALSQVVLSPYWHVPQRIALQDKLPVIRKDPHYLARHGFQVVRGRHVIDPTTIAWAQLTRTHFPYRLRQRPGATNALGRIKFLLPNPFDVYLHDTPARALFHAPVRTFSSGCIRLEKPLELAAYLLRADPVLDPGQDSEGRRAAPGTGDLVSDPPRRLCALQDGLGGSRWQRPVSPGSHKHDQILGKQLASASPRP